MEKKFDIPGFTYFKEKNIYSGSVTTEKSIFNYKIYPGEEFSVITWQGKFCLDKTPEEDILEKKNFEFTSDGLDQIRQWLDEKQLSTVQ